MYSKEMEDLIEVTLADGILTDQEKQVLVKRAEDEGIDLNELDVYIQSILYKKKQAQIDQEVAEERQHKHGEIKKCPSCGAIITGMIAKCTQCGYEFRGLEANKSAEKLAEKLAAVKGEDTITIQQKQASIISSFPVPNTKEDLMEFLISMTAAEKNLGQYAPGERALKEAYRSKMQECVTKARISFANDTMMQQIIAESQAVLNTPLKSTTMYVLKIVGAVFAVLLILALILIALGV